MDLTSVGLPATSSHDAQTNSWAAGTDGNDKTLCRHDLRIVWTRQHEITRRAARIPNSRRNLKR
jgi:hypothetical protein